MIDTSFNRKSWAQTYARKHLETDSGIRLVIFLPEGAPADEIRLVEINEQIAVRDDDLLEAIDFGVDCDSPNAHRLKVLDITPGQWERIERNLISLPDGWSRRQEIRFARESK